MRKIQILLNFLILALTVPVWAGAGAHGGVSVVCRNTNGAISNAETLDLFEARNWYGYNIIKTNTSPWETQAQNALARLEVNPLIKPYLLTAIATVKAGFKILEQEAKIPPTNDSFPVLKKKNCDFEQAAVFTPEKRVLVDQEIFSHMGQTDRAALFVHEVAYLLARELAEEPSSVRARKVTGLLLATNYSVDELKRETEYWILPPQIQSGTYKNDSLPEDTFPCTARVLTIELETSILTIASTNTCKNPFSRRYRCRRDLDKVLTRESIYCTSENPLSNIWITNETTYDEVKEKDDKEYKNRFILKERAQ